MNWRSSLGSTWRRTTLIQRLVVLGMLPTGLFALLLVMFLTHRQIEIISTLTRSAADSIAAQTAEIATEPLREGDRTELERIARVVSRLPHVTRVSFRTSDHRLSLDIRNQAEDPKEPPLAVQRVIRSADGTPLATLSLELAQDDALAMQRTGLYLALLSLLVALLLAGLMSWQVARWISKPLRTLAVAVGELGRGSHEVAVDVTDDTEIGNLQRGFNAAATALVNLQRDLKLKVEVATKALTYKNAELETARIAKARFLASATHDLRQPLYALTLFSSSLAMEETDPGRLDRIARIQECVDSLDRLFSDLLDLSRLETGALRPEWSEFDLDGVFREVSRNFRIFAEQRALRLVVRKTDCRVRSDRTMLARILANLVGNSLRYTTTGGVLVGARRHGGRMRVDVWDTGCGIDPGLQHRVFEEFFRVPGASKDRDGNTGFGLGLSTVKKLTELLGTTVRLGSRPGRGSVFSFDVPLAETCANARTVTTKADTPFDISDLRVLVIDDDVAILSAITFLFRGWGCELRTAEDGEQALRTAASWGSPPDIVISDLRLRHGMNGLEVLHALDQHYGRVADGRPAFARLLITGETRAERLREVTAANVPVLFKPVAPEPLREAIVAACAIQRSTAVATRAAVSELDTPVC